MTTQALDNLHRNRFDWPEPLVLDLVADSYDAQDDVGRWTAVHLHARFLRHLVEGDAAHAARPELLAQCAARGVGHEMIERAEQVVFCELIDLVEMRFRNSPRVRDTILAQLDAAREMLGRRAEPARKAPAPLLGRVPLRLRAALVLNAA